MKEILLLIGVVENGDLVSGSSFFIIHFYSVFFDQAR